MPHESKTEGRPTTDKGGERQGGWLWSEPSVVGT